MDISLIKNNQLINLDSLKNHVFLLMYEHCGVEGHDIDHCYSLCSKFCPNKSINNKDCKSKGGRGVNNDSQTKGKTIGKASSKANEQGQGVGMAITHDLFVRLEKLINNMASQKLEEKKVVTHCSTSAPTYLRLDPS
jgi:hypothetical protein